MTDPDDRTLDAEPDALARLREIARSAERSNGDDGAVDDRTADVDADALDRLRAAARAASSRPDAPRRPARDLAELPDPGQIPELDRPAARRVAPPAQREPWRPPPRSMRPAALPTSPRPHGTHPLWKWAALALAALSVVLIVWLAFGRGDDGDDDVPTGPTVTGPSGTVLTTGVAGRGGSGG